MQAVYRLGLLKLFVTALATTVLLFVIDIVIANRLSTNNARIVCDVVVAFLAILLFLIGSAKSVQQKRWDWLVLNVILIVIIIAWTVWFALLLYAFRDFKLTLPA